MLQTDKSPGAQVRAGQRLAIVSDRMGESAIKIVTPLDGVVTGSTNLPLVHEGHARLNIAVIEGMQIAARALDSFDPFEEYESGSTEELAKAELPLA